MKVGSGCVNDKLTRKCVKCGKVKPVWDFPINNRMASGRDVRCIKCVREHREMFESAWMDKYNVRGVF